MVELVSAVDLAERYWREQVARKDESRFTICVLTLRKIHIIFELLILLGRSGKEQYVRGRDPLNEVVMIKFVLNQTEIF